MKFAPFVNIQCREGFDYAEVYRARMDECVLAEELGFDSIFLAEHAFSEHGPGRLRPFHSDTCPHGPTEFVLEPQSRS